MSNKKAFKVGDNVEILDTPQVRTWPNGKNAIGQIGTITDTISRGSGMGYIIDDNKWGINFTSKMIKHTTLKPFTFKKGMKVEIFNDGALYTTFNEMASQLGATKYEHGWGVYFGDGIKLNGTHGVIINLFKNYVLVDIGDHEIVINKSGLKALSKNISTIQPILTLQMTP